MKIIFITRESKQMPAVRVRCYGFAKYLNQAGIETEIFSFADNLGAKSGKEESKMSLADKMVYNLKAFKYLWDKDAVLFLQRCNYHSLAPLLVSLLRNRKLIFDLDDWEARENIEYYFGRFPKSLAYAAMSFIARKSCLCLGASKFLEDFLLSYNQNVIYAPTAVDTEIFKPEKQLIEKHGLVLSWIGTMHRKDNLENLYFLIDCFQILRNKVSGIKLEILGDGVYVSEVKRKVEQLNSDLIIIKDWMAPEDIPEYLNQIDIGIMPLIQDTKFNKAKSPTRMFEYMAMEKPFVASCFAEARRIIIDGENGMLAVTKDDFVNKLLLLCKDKNLRQAMGKKARKTVLEKYSLEKTAKDLLKVIRLI
ncbi:MAG: glycosyltransferase [Candidatus Omnitrophota bacterium]